VSGDGPERGEAAARRQVDESSLFLLPLESPEKAAGILREMFARILP
jgi:hypothetical protein